MSDKTMNDIYRDGSEHIACSVCGLCKDCGDCECQQSNNFTDRRERMSEQEEFEKVWLNILIPGEYDSMDDFDKDRWRCAIRQSFDEGWQACAERKDKIIEQLTNSANYWKAEHQAANKVIEQQAAELAVLRGFVKAIQYDLEPENWGAYPKGLLKIYKLIDENGKPTKLLTGEE